MAQDLEAAFKATAQTVAASQKAVKDLQDDDRSHIAKVIIWAFVIYMGVVIVVFSVGVFFIGWDKLGEAAKFMLSMLSSVLLPVVTLVIGHYFGKQK
jgi:cytochrome bd-type quinol oxidase subunit 1